VIPPFGERVIESCAVAGCFAVGNVVVKSAQSTLVERRP